MKTADQIIEENFTNQFAHSEKVIIKQLMQIVHRQACEEQRKNCFLSAYNAKSPSGSQKAGIRLYYQDMSQKEFRDTILNAPEPELK